VHRGELQQTEWAEVQAWWNQYTARQAGTGGSFNFQSASLRSRFFNPRYAGTGVLQSVNVVHDGTAPLTDVSERARLILGGEVATDMSSNPIGTLEHISLVLNTPGATLTVNGGLVTSHGLPLGRVQSAPQQAQINNIVSQQTLAAVNSIIVNAPGWAQAAGGVPEWEKLANGVPSTRDDFKAAMEEFLSPFPVDPVLVIPVDVLVEQFAVVPFLAVIFSDGYVLVDPFAGAVSPLFKPESAIDATSLLEPYAHEASIDLSGLAYFDAWGKEMDEVPLVAAGGQIRIRCKTIVNIPGSPASHCWVEFSPPVDDRGENPDYCGAHPTCPTFQQECPSSPPFGSIRTCCGTWRAPPGCPEPNFPDDPNDPLRGIRTTLLYCKKGTDLAGVFSCIKSVMDKVNTCNIPYNVTGCNSNSTLRYALEKCAGSCTYKSPPRAATPAVGWEMSESCRDRFNDCFANWFPL